MKKIILIIFLILIINFCLAQTFYPTTINELDATVRIFGFGNIKNLNPRQEVSFQTLTFQETEYQEIEIITESLYTKNNILKPQHVFDEFGNKYVKFLINENGDFNYEIIAKVKTKALLYEIEEVEIGNYPEQLQEYVKRSRLIESDSTEIKTIVKNKFTSNYFLETLNEIIFWTNDYVEYADGDDFQYYHLLQKSGLDTLLSKKGVCNEFSNLAASLLRAKNIPTRIATGPTFDGKEWGHHAWIEVYHEKNGWVPSDPTFREPGFVDGTHIKMGSFIDISQSQAKAIFPSNVEMTFQTQTLPEIEVNSKKFFSHVDLKWKEKKLIANQWNEINLEITNKTSGQLTIPIKIQEDYDTKEFYEKNKSNIFFYEKTKSIVLTGGEKSNIIFKVYPKISLESNQFAKGILTFNSLTEPFTIDFEIHPGEEINDGEIVLKDITPISTTINMRFEIKLSNNTNKNEIVKIFVNNDNTFDYELKPFEKKWLRKEVEIGDMDYVLEIITPTKIYTQTIVPVARTTIIETPKETIIVQQIINDKETTSLNLVEIMIFALLPIIAIALLLIFATKKRYV
jgi:hypothetical protein